MALPNLGESTVKELPPFYRYQVQTASAKLILGVNFSLDSWEKGKLKQLFLVLSENRRVPHLSSCKTLEVTAGRSRTVDD